MSYQIVDEVLTEPCFKAEDKLVLLILARYANNATRQAWPSIETIEFESCLNRRTVQRSLRRLESLRIIKDVTKYYGRKPKSGGLKYTTCYEIAAHDLITKIIGADWDNRPKRTRKKQRPADAVKGVPQTQLTASTSQANSVPQSPNSVYESAKGVPQTHESIKNLSVNQSNESVMCVADSVL